MARSADEQALREARAEIEALASAFAEAARPAVEAALHRRLEALREARSTWWSALSPEVAAAFADATDRAVRSGSAQVERRLADLEIWLSPLTAPGLEGPSQAGWDAALPDWVSAILQRLSRRPGPPEVGELDDAGNRIWVAISSAARAIDPVLEEFGLEPSSFPELGGGHYGLQPRTAEQLDPSGSLLRLWRRYRLVHQRFAALSAELRTR